MRARWWFKDMYACLFHQMRFFLWNVPAEWCVGEPSVPWFARMTSLSSTWQLLSVFLKPKSRYLELHAHILLTAKRSFPLTAGFPILLVSREWVRDIQTPQKGRADESGVLFELRSVFYISLSSQATSSCLLKLLPVSAMRSVCLRSVYGAPAPENLIRNSCCDKKCS